MGANVWKREGEAGRTFSVGAQQQKPRPDARPGPGRPPGGHAANPGNKRKLVWSRSDAAAMASDQSSAGATTGQSPLQPHAQASRRLRPAGDGAGAAMPTAALPQAAAASRAAGQPGAREAKRHQPKPQHVAAQPRSAAADAAAASAAAHGRPHANGAAGAANGNSSSGHNCGGSAGGSRLSADAAALWPAPASGSPGDVSEASDAAARAAQQEAERAARRALAAKQSELVRLRRAMAQQQRRLAANQVSSPRR